VVDINANLTIEINVNDYEQVIRNDKGRLLGTMTKVPGASSFLKGKVDETIEEQVKKNLEQTLPSKLADELTKGLQEEGVQASVSVSLAYQ
jgi:myo-inositol-1-phosphate synthase